MGRRSFLKLFRAVPLISIIQMKNTQGLSHRFGSLENIKPLSILKILEDVSPGQLVVIGSRFSIDKSTVAMNLLNEITFVQNESCVYHSLEITRQNLIRRWTCLKANVSSQSLLEGTLSANELERANLADEVISNSKVFICDNSEISTESIAKQIVDLKKSGKNIKFVFIDYLNLLQSKNSDLSRFEQVLHELKALAVKENLILIALSRVNKGIELHSSFRLRPYLLQEINNLSSIDKIILLNRKHYYVDGILEKNTQLDFFIYKDHVKAKIDYWGMLNPSNFKIDQMTAVSNHKLKLMINS